MEDGQQLPSQAFLSTGNPADHTGPGTVPESGCKEPAPVSSGDAVHATIDGSSRSEGNMGGQNHVTQDPQLVGYGSMNGSAGDLGSKQPAGAAENGLPSTEPMASAAEQPFVDVNSAEEDRLWSIVRANCLDFNAWTALIEETEKVSENNIVKIRKIYDAFLAEFPLCFGYWKKYADHEGRLDSVDKVVEVYERAVHAVTYSVDMWLHYCVFAISTYEDPNTIRRLFERGLAFVGTDYLSYPLWDEYIRYEEAQQAWINLQTIYTRILENPIQQLDRYLNCFKELATSRPLSDIRTQEEAELLASTIHSPRPYLETEAHPDGAEQSPKPENADLTGAEVVVKFIEVREDLYKKAKEMESKLIGFEIAIRRPYFHVRPLDDPELENWHNYLDFAEKEYENDLNKVIKLYERCLVACANYTEFWIRYVLYVQVYCNYELAYNALARATHIFVKKQPEIHLFAAKFKELCGDIEGAQLEYQFLYSEISPCLLEAIIKHANLEYRLGNKEVAYSIYEKIIAAEKEKEQSQILPMLLVQYSRFLYLVDHNLEKAREVLFGSLDKVQLSKPLLEAVIHLETIQLHSEPKRIDRLDSLVEKFISPNTDNPDVASTSDREEISCIFMEFLDMFGNAESIKKADDRHMKLFLRQKSSLLSKKRRADDFLTSDRTKVSRTSADDGSSGQSVVNAQNQWAVGYGQRAPWPQNSQAQGQQWNPGYAPQPAYNAYGYANYGPPQAPAPTSSPQIAAYAPYPPAYTAQAYPQQSYPQPPVATATYPQQQGAVPQQPYYGSYY